MPRDKITLLRSEIDRIDRQLLKLLNKRIKVSVNIGAVKLARAQQVFAPEREEDVLQRLERLNPGPLDRAALRSIYREVINSSVAVQAKLAIGYLGRRGSQSAMMAANRFGSSHDYRGFASVERLGEALMAGQVEIGVAARPPLLAHGLEVGKVAWPVCGQLTRPESKEGEPYYLLSRTQGAPGKRARTVFWLEPDSAEICVKNVKSLLQMEKLKLVHSEIIRLQRPVRGFFVQVDVSGDVSVEDAGTLMSKLPPGRVRRWCRLGCFS